MSCVLGVAVITMLGAGMRGCGGGQGPNQEQPGHMAPVVTVGNFKISPDMVKDPQGESPIGTDRMRSEGQKIDSLISGGLALILAKKENVDLSDSNVKQRIILQSLTSARQYLEGNGRLRPGASQQEFENAYKSANGGESLPDARKRLEAQIDEKFKNDEDKVQAQSAAAPVLLIDKFKSKFNPSEDEIKKQFDTIRLKLLAITPKMAGVKPTDAKARDAQKAKAEAILKEIKAGTTFEAEMDKYLDKPKEKGKKASDESIPLPASSVAMNPFLGFISKMKPGQVSDVVEMPDGPTLVKFESQKIDLPKDYDAQKPQLLDKEAQNQAAKYVSDEIKKLDTAANVKWDSEGYHVLHDFLAVDSSKTADPDRNKKLKDIISRAIAAQTNPIGGDAAAAAARLALRSVASGLPAAEASKLTTQVLAIYVQQFPEVDAKIELAEAYVKAGDGDNAAATLKDAADVNSVRTDEEGKANWDLMNKAIKDGQEKKLLSADAVKSLDAAYAKWLKDYAAEQQQKKEDEAQRKKTEEELNKTGKQPVAPDTTTPTTPPAGKPGKDEPKKEQPKADPGKKGNSVLHPENNATGKH